MGFIFSKSMNENMKDQKEFMLMNARLQVCFKIIKLLSFYHMCSNPTFSLIPQNKMFLGCILKTKMKWITNYLVSGLV